MSRASPFAVAYLGSAGLEALGARRGSGILGEIRYGVEPRPQGMGDWPLAAIQAPRLDGGPDGTRGLSEVWRSSDPVEGGGAEGILYRRTDDLLFGVATEDARYQGSDPTASLQEAAEQGYRRIFGLIDGLGYPSLVRAWNYFADINREDQGLERYRQFNAGRQDAFIAAGRSLTAGVPAACALGVGGQPLTIAFLAARGAVVAIENPRQVSAYCYPPEYGRRSPTFSRATLARVAGQPVLFVSGTASIAGHETRHPGDPAAQTGESLANLQAVMEAANHVVEGPAFNLSQTYLKVYLRHPAHLDAVRGVLVQALGEPLTAAFLQAEICRVDLLVEIEATAGLPVMTS
jgi:chorismate lyase / 3-hydroxybenzoate synthase